MLIAAVTALAAKPEFADVFTAGAEGYTSIRIPAMLVSNAGSVLAFAEGRQRPQDQAENDFVSKRSTDGGRTWSPLKVLHDDGLTWSTPQDVTATTKYPQRATTISSGPAPAFN